WFSKVFVSDFKEIVPVEFAQPRRDLMEYVTHQLAPPLFVVIFAGTIDCPASRPLLPRCVKCALQCLCIEIQSDFSTYIGVMVTHCFRQMKERACGVEKDCSDHFNANVQRTSCLRNTAR